MRPATLLLIFLSACTMEVAGESDPELDEESLAGCERSNEVLVWGTRNFGELLDAVEKDRSPCSTWWVSLPPIADEAGRKTVPRSGDILDRIHAMRAEGIRIRAMAEFHWTSWRAWTEATGGTWHEAGMEFRRRMDEAGYDPAGGDIWVIDEFPTSVRKGEEDARLHARYAVRGLYEGATPNIRGAVLVIGVGIETSYFGEYSPTIEGWLCDTTFWQWMDKYVRFFGQETYADPYRVCVAGASVGERSLSLNNFLVHLARKAGEGPSCADTAMAYFDRAYVPLQSAAWQQSIGYGDTRISAEEMRQFVRLGVYAQRAWSSDHQVPDGRIGFAWAPASGSDPVALRGIAEAMAGAIARAYAPGGKAVDACSTSGSYDGCDCELAGAALNNTWTSFPGW